MSPTRAPAAAMCTAIARPMPRLAPVTIATLPARLWPIPTDRTRLPANARGRQGRGRWWLGHQQLAHGTTPRESIFHAVVPGALRLTDAPAQPHFAAAVLAEPIAQPRVQVAHHATGGADRGELVAQRIAQPEQHQVVAPHFGRRIVGQLLARRIARLLEARVMTAQLRAKLERGGPAPRDFGDRVV